MKKYVSVFNLFLAATFFLVLFGCKKGLTENQEQSERRSPSTELLPPDVYVVGSENNQAKYWKNGQGFVLPGGIEATGVVVVGPDVYICGNGIHPTTKLLVALYWKNGVLTTLSDGSDYVMANGIAVSGTDVYVTARVGDFGYSSVYYKNGVATSLGSTKANGIVAAANGDIYIPNAQEGNPSYFKNGTLVTLPRGSSNSLVRAMAVYGSDVFAVGQDWVSSKEKALYWKNGAAQTLVQQFNSAAKAVAVNSMGQPVISGTTGQDLNNLHIAYWPMPVGLQTLSPGQFVALNTGVAVDVTTDDVYVCGTEFENQVPTAKAKYWKITSTGGTQSFTMNTGSSNATVHAIALGY